VLGEWPLCGRETELRRFKQLLADQRCGAVVLAGEPGVGKTFFAKHCLRNAARTGYTTTEVTGTNAAAGLPFGAFAHLLPSRDHGQVGAVDRETDLLRRLAGRLADRAGPRGLVLFVDDAHTLDNASATLVRHLVVSRLAFVLATIRSGTPMPDAITWLWKDQHAERIELSGPTDGAVVDLLPKVLGGSVDPATVSTLMNRSSGNMLFLRELVYGAVQSHTLRQQHGIWRLAGPLAPSRRLSELVQIRLEALTSQERGLLEIVSFGEPLGPQEIATLAPPAVAEELERKSLLRTTSDGRRLEFRLAHPLYGDVIRAATPTLRARSIATALADAVERTGARRREDALRIATWRLDAGGGDPDLMLAAAKIARWRYDFRLAERLAVVAADAGGSFEARLLVAELAHLQGRADEAERLFADLSGMASDDAQRATVASLRIDNLAVYQGKLAEAMQVADDAERIMEDPDAINEVRAKRSTIVLGLAGFRAAAEHAEPLVERAKGKALVWSCAIGAHALGRVGQLDRALSFAERGYAAHLELSEAFEWYRWIHLFFRCEAEAYAGRFADAEKLALAEHQTAVQERSEEAQACFAFELARISIRRGHMNTGERQAREAMALFGSLGWLTFEQSSAAFLAIALAAQGRPREATEAFTISEQISEAMRSPIWLYPVDLHEARAWIAVAHGDLPGAFDHLAEGRQLAGSTGDHLGEAFVLNAFARLGRAEEVQSRLDELAHLVEGRLVAGFAAHAAGLASDDAHALDKLSETFEVMGTHLLAAECSAEAAIRWRRDGRNRSAALAEQRATMLSEICGEVKTPGLSKIGDRARLTPTELQVCLLAQSGRSNKAIADELVISVRTVGNHLQHAYQKLGISKRDELKLR
jgi:DNA-binding CsgD family transcriptional regulator